MVQVIQEQGSLAGRIGKGFAKGFSDNFQKEVDRHRLSQGLENLGNENLTGQNRLSILGKILAIPGMTPEMAPYALQAIQSQNFRNRAGGTPQTGGSGNTPTPGNQPSVQPGSQTLGENTPQT